MPWLAQPPMQRRGARAPQKQSTDGVALPAPVGGINALDPARQMPPTDALQIWNMIPYQYGLRVRSGWKEWATNVGVEAPEDFGLYDDGSPMAFSLAGPLGGALVGAYLGVFPYGPRTLIAFYGSSSDGSGDRLFAACEDGIYDVTSSTTSPSKVYSFPIEAATGRGFADAGYGVYTAFANAANEHFIAYCDGYMGYMLYRESTDSWSTVSAGDGTGGTINVIDGAGDPAPDPSSFRFVMSWKNRLWFAADGSTTGYFLPINNYAGTLETVYFGSRFRYGGSLVGLWSWTVDGGAGIDDLLVAISTAGDVVIYEGWDPATPGAFALRGVWWVGQVPPGRNIASDFGGDLFILSRLGCLPLSKLVAGGLIRDPTIFATSKIANLFNSLMTERGDRPGWSIKMHPSDNLMVINVPATPSQVQQQITMSLASKGWSQHIGVPMMCMEAWKGRLYFGTWNNQVCVNEGFVDGQTLDGAEAAAIDFGVLTSFQNFGNTRKKRVQMIRPLFVGDDTNPGYTAEARYEFEMAPIHISPIPDINLGALWDTALWDTAIWDDGIGTSNEQRGATGLGANIGIIIRGTAKTKTTLVGFDVLVDQGGFL